MTVKKKIVAQLLATVELNKPNSGQTETDSLSESLNDSQSIQLKAVFSSYYKYCFYYEAQYKGKPLTIYIGGSADDIYKMELSAEQSFDINEEQIDYIETTEKYSLDLTE